MALKAAVDLDAINIETNGEGSSEYKVAQTTNKWMNLLMLVGGVAAAVPAVLGPIIETVPATSKIAAIGGAIIAVAGAVGRVLTTLGYSRDRSELKSNMALAAAQKSK